MLAEPRTVLPLGSGAVLMGPGDGGVDTDVPVDLTGQLGIGLRRGQHPLPRAVGGEAVLPLPRRLPRPEPLGQITARPPVRYRNTIPSTT